MVEIKRTKKETNKTTKILFVIELFLTLILMGTIFYFSSQPADESQELSDGIVYHVIVLFRAVIPSISFNIASFIVRKAAHMTEYLLLGFFWSQTVVNFKKLRDHIREIQTGFLRMFLSSWIVPVLHAISDEIHQSYVPGRSCEIRDMCIDACGALIGVLIALAFQHKSALRK